MRGKSGTPRIVASRGIIWWQQVATVEAESEERERERRGGEVYGRGRGWATDEKVRAGYVIILGFKLKRCSFDFF